jgi:hypothetical protein
LDQRERAAPKYGVLASLPRFINDCTGFQDKAFFIPALTAGFCTESHIFLAPELTFDDHEAICSTPKL